MTTDQAKINYIVEHISKICTYNVSEHAKKLMLSHVQDLHEVSLERTMSETITLSQGKITRIHMGKGYRDLKALARREYSLHNMIKYNHSSWEIINPDLLSSLK